MEELNSGIFYQDLNGTNLEVFKNKGAWFFVLSAGKFGASVIDNKTPYASKEEAAKAGVDFFSKSVFVEGAWMLQEDSFVLVTYEFGSPIFIAPLNGLDIDVTDAKEDAERWSYADTLSSVKLRFHKSQTGYQGLIWEKI